MLCAVGSAGLDVGVLLAAQEGAQTLIPGPELPGRFLAWVTLQEMMSHATLQRFCLPVPQNTELTCQVLWAVPTKKTQNSPDTEPRLPAAPSLRALLWEI